MSTLRITSLISVAAAILFTVGGLVAPSAMAAGGERVLDPRLSLIGGCKAEELDPLEDPGCPTTPPRSTPGRLVCFPPCGHDRLPWCNYVANYGKKEDGTEGSIDIFRSEGRFISEIPVGVVRSPQALAVDSTGTLYVWSEKNGELLRFSPCAPYKPVAGEIDYCEPPTALVLTGPFCSEPTDCGNRGVPGFRGLAVNPQNEHLFFVQSGQIVEYGSGAEGNEEIRWNRIADGSGTGADLGIALDTVRHRLYAQDGPDKIDIYNLAEGLPAARRIQKDRHDRCLLLRVPGGAFGGLLTLAVDEGTGRHISSTTPKNSHLWEFDEDGNYPATVEFLPRSPALEHRAIDCGR